MSETPPEVEAPEETETDRLHEALLQFTHCIGESLEDVCSYGITIGDTYVPFNPDEDDDCEEDEVFCSQAWVRVMGVSPGEGTSESWGGDCAVTLSIDIEVGVLRCVEVPEDGEAPTASEVMVGAMQAMTDMKAIHCAAMGCEVWDAISTGSWSPNGPLGGQYGGIWTFTVEL